MKPWRTWTNLDAEIAAEGDVVGSLALGEEVPRGSGGRAGAPGALEHDQALPLVEVGGERGEVELGEEGALQGGVDAVHGAELPLLHLMVQQPAVARRLHRSRPRSKNLAEASPPTVRRDSPLRRLELSQIQARIDEINETGRRGKGDAERRSCV